MIMASTPESRRTTIPDGDSKNRGGASASYFQKTVCLHDWWLIRAQNDFNGKTLAVAGLTSRPEQPVRVFSSAPIVKRYDVFTLETADGICVVIKGFINKLRTTDNGFTDEVFKHFVFGFPSNWETYAANCFLGEAFDGAAAAGNVSDTDNLLCKIGNADMNNCTLTHTSSPLCENSPNNKQDSYVEEDCSPLESDAKQGLNHGDTIAQDVMQSTSATEIVVPFTDLAGSPNKTGVAIQDEEVEDERKKEKESWKKAKRKINNQDSYVAEDCSPLESDAKQGLNHGATMAQDVMQSTNATEIAVPFTDLAGSPNKIDADIQDEEVENKRKKKRESWKKAKRKILFDSPGSGISMNTRERKEKQCIVSPECMSYGRSRSGRLLLPAMEFWRNQLPVYDSDRKIRGIQEGLPEIQPQPRGSKSEGGRKR